MHRTWAICNAPQLSKSCTLQIPKPSFGFWKITYLLWLNMSMSTPDNGLMIDPFAVILSLSCSVMTISKAAAVIEKEELCFYPGLNCFICTPIRSGNTPTAMNLRPEGHHVVVVTLKMQTFNYRHSEQGRRMNYSWPKAFLLHFWVPRTSIRRKLTLGWESRN